MAQSRVQKGKGKKSKFPMWGIGIVVVLVVAIAGYAIVRFSKASGSGGNTIGIDANSIKPSAIAPIPTKVRIPKYNGSGYVDAWALPQGASVFGVAPGGEFSVPYYFKVDTCSIMQRVGGASGTATIHSWINNGTITIGKPADPALSSDKDAVVNVSTYKNYCSSSVGVLSNKLNPYTRYNAQLYIKNNAPSTLYVLTMSIVY